MDETKTTETPGAPPTSSTDLNPFRIEVKRKEATQPKPSGFDITPSTTTPITPSAPSLDTPSPVSVPEPDLAVPATPEKEMASKNLADALKAEPSAAAPVSDAFDAAMQSATTSGAQPAKKGKGLAITAVVLVVLAVIAGAGYAYMQTRPEKAKDTPVPAASATPKPAAITPADVDKSTTDIDDNLKKVDDTKDFAATDINDATVGL